AAHPPGRPAAAGRRRHRGGGRDRARPPDRLEGDRRRAAGARQVRALVRHARRLAAGRTARALRRRQLPLRHRDHVAAHAARRDARGHPERRHRALGHPRPRPGPARRRRAGAARRPRLDPALRRAVVERLEHLHGDRRARDHDPPDRLEHQSRALPRRPAGAEGGRARARHDAVGDGARRHVPVRARRHRGRPDPRARPRHRRGDRSHAGDRRRRLHPLEPVLERRHARVEDRGVLPGRDEPPPGRLAHLPRADPPRLLAPDERRRAVHRASGREAAGHRHAPRRTRMNGRSEGITADELRAVNLPRRKALNRGMELLATLTALIAVGLLVIVTWSVAKRGASALDWNLLTKDPKLFDFTGAPQGLANAFAGSLVLVGLATAMALPVGILVAVYLTEFAPVPVRTVVSLALDVLNGIPAIVIGIFVFGLLVVGHGQSGLKGAFALACLMLPLVARATMEVLLLVPSSLREASLGLGVPRWRTTLSIVLPQTIGGVLTGTVLAVARVAGETAPLLFTSSLVSGRTDWNPSHALQ